MNLSSIEQAYRRYANHYDTVFGPILHQGREMVVDGLRCRPGERVLEVGVGTGLSLPLYPTLVKVTGIDLSEEMLDKARHRTAELGLKHVEAIQRMDAENMTFEDDSFDTVVAMYVVSVVADPVRLVNEMRRVCRPDGKIVIVNHFKSTHPLISRCEKLLAPLSRYIGFRPDLELEDFLKQTDLVVVHERRVNLFGYWTMLTCKNGASASMAA